MARDGDIPVGMGTSNKGGQMNIGDILVDARNNQVYLVKAFMPKYPKRVLLLDLEDGRTFTIQKVIARQWTPTTKETQ